MLIMLLAAALDPWRPDEGPPLMITVPAAASNPDFMDRPVEVCGHVTRLDTNRNEAEIFGVERWLRVDIRGRAEMVVGRATCVTGVIRRRDGLTERQRRERGLGLPYVYHGASSEILLYQCHDPASCDRLMQPGPVRPEQLDGPGPRP